MPISGFFEGNLGTKKGPRKALFLKSGAPGETRTPNLQVRSLLLYPIEPRAQEIFIYDLFLVPSRTKRISQLFYRPR